MKQAANQLRKILNALDDWQNTPDIKFALRDTGKEADLNYAKADLYAVARRIEEYKLP